MVHAENLTPDSLLAAMNQGDFYASSGVALKQVRFDADKRELNIEIDAVEGETYSIQFIGTLKGYDETTSDVTDDEGNVIRTTKVYSEEVGKVLQEIEGNSATLPVPIEGSSKEPLIKFENDPALQNEQLK